MEDQRLETSRNVWHKRQELFGNTPRSVLYKGLPDSLNLRLHRLHVEFILKSLPKNAKNMLDIGCGYGRIAKEVLHSRSDIDIYGVELCSAFSKKFNDDIGPCFNGAFEKFVPDQEFDMVLMLTILMYQDREALPELLLKYWNAVRQGGSLTCIEPYENFLVLRKQRQNTHGRRVVPACNEYYFKSGELLDSILRLPGAKLQRKARFGMLPIFDLPVLHDAVTVTKERH